MIFLSIITPTYNRKELVIQTINSTIDFVKHTDCETEIIVVDDASTDFTYEYLKKIYNKELTAGDIRLFRSEKNLGVTGAKNLGAKQAGGEWLLFMDSDDLLIPDVAEDLINILHKYKDSPIIFFRCKGLETGYLIGPHFRDPYELTLKEFLNKGTPGECLPVVKSSSFSQFFYNTKLRGCEGLTYAQMINEFGAARVETLIARKYRRDNDDRLSSGKGLISRSCCLAKYHALILSNYYNKLYITTIIKTSLKAIFYLFMCIIFKVKH